MNQRNATVIRKAFGKNLWFLPKPAVEFLYKAVVLVLFAR